MSKKALGFWSLLALSIGNMVGAGVFLVPATLASIGSITLYSWALTAIGTIFLALIFLDFNRIIPTSGGPFTYAHHVFGDYVGFAVAYSYWIAWCVGNAGMSVALSGYLASFFPNINDPWVGFFTKCIPIWLVTLINILGVKKSSVFQVVTTAAKIIPLLLIAIGGLFYIQYENLQMGFNLTGQSDFSAICRGLAITLWAYIGFESCTIPSEESAGTEKIKKATLYGLIITTIIYLLGSFTLMGMIPASVLQHSSAPYADGAVAMFGPSAKIWIALGAIISIVGALNGSILIQVHVVQAAAKKKLFLPAFAQNSQYGTPYKGFLYSATLITTLLLLTVNQTLMNQFNFIILLSTFSFLIPYFVVATGHLYILSKHRSNRFRQLRWAITILGMGYAFWTMVSVEMSIVFYGALFFLTSFPLYALLKKKRDDAAEGRTG
ncbi:MAG: amino acid permease [Verrucomicrobia bacterium]|nr:amino acid permease [Verrucomicrobiota bacterium]